MTVQPVAAPQAAAVAAPRAHPWRRAAIILLGVVTLFALTYAFAWTQAQALSVRYLADADATYQKGDFLKALVGYQEFDQKSNTYITKGGYMQVERIWQNAYAWPVPAGVERARARIDEIINRRLTVDQAEQFVQQNIGQRNPYFGTIYLRLGELYERQGKVSDARDVYQTVLQTFGDQPDLVKQAQDHLTRLQGK